jgi:hypothetical protein
MSDRDVQRLLIVAFHDDSRKADAWNLETPDRDVRFTC